jgi:hypothetical protein
MAALPQYLDNYALEQPGPKFVPPPNAPQAVALQEAIQRVKVRIRPTERRRTHILLGTINHADFRVIKAIPVHLDMRGATVIASWRQVDEFGTGKSSSQACDDLGHTIAELYVSLKADASRLGPDLAKVWGILREHVVLKERAVPKS